MASITVTGLEEIIAKLQKVNQLDRHLGPAMEEATAHVERVARRYPPPVAGSKYIRTYFLQSSWFRGQRGLKGWVRNVGPAYNTFVQGQNQRPFHRAHGWKTEDDIAQSEAATVTRIISSALTRAIR